MKQIDAMRLIDLSAVTPTVPTTLEELLDLEAIKVLRARFWQAIDGEMWDVCRSLFTADARIEMDGTAFESIDELVSIAESVMSAHRTFHQAWGVPIIELRGADEASGIWYVATAARGEEYNQSERGLYHEQYGKENGSWLIQHANLIHSIIQPEDGTIEYDQAQWWDK